jgi:RalA-binding protein 1
MSHNRHAYAAQSAASATQDHDHISSPTSPSSLADSLRALREKAPSNSESLANRRNAPKPTPLNPDLQRNTAKLYSISPLSPNSLQLFALPPGISPGNLPNSPRDRLDALLSPTSASPNHDRFSPAKTASPNLNSIKSDTSLTPVDAPISLVNGSFSPPLSPATQPTYQNMARNLSIDSTVSSVSSSTSHPPRSTVSPIKTQSSDAIDPATLIAQAGSVEAAIQGLLKEKQSLGSHNSQLWRLVEKQRSMILGLQKDLEKVLKDKERYRRKWKEHQHQQSISSSITPDREIERDLREKPKSIVPPPTKLAGPNPLVQPSPVLHSPHGSTSDHTSIEASPITSVSARDRSQTPLTELSHISPTEIFQSQQLPTKKEARQPPALTIINPTPTFPGASFPSPPLSLSGRRTVPAPLTLALSNLSPPSQQTQFPDQSPVRITNGAPTEELPRGRRRTRQDDDRIREAIAIQEEEARSTSKKSKSKSANHSSVATPVVSPTLSVPAHSLDKAVSPVTAPSPSMHPLNSNPQHTTIANGLLNPAGSDTKRHSIVNSLLSPGLPMSPRPGHRPANSPSPRDPRSDLSRSPTFGGADETEDSNKSSQPETPIEDSVNPDNATFSSPSAIPAPLFTKAEDESSPKPEARTAEHRQDSLPQPDGQIFRGFVSEQHPHLLLPPNALPMIHVRVFSSRLRPSRNSILIAKPLDQDPVFLLGIYSRENGKQLWRVEKTLHALPALHNRLRARSKFPGKLPDPDLFEGHAPVKIDARRAALNAYFDTLLDTQLPEDAALTVCQFFSTDVMDPEDEPSASTVRSSSAKPKELPRREGYLTKRGKNFGGWKSRFFVLDGGPDLKYYDVQGGPQVGVIKLATSQIGKQSTNRSNQSPAGRDEDNQYRHAFLILEPKKRDATTVIRHALCAESDDERDAWVTDCLAYVNYKGDKKLDQSAKNPFLASSTSTQSSLPNLQTSSTSTPLSNSPEKRGKDGSLDRGTPSSTHSSNAESLSSRQNLMDANSERRTGSPKPSARSKPDSRDEGQTIGLSYEQTIQAEAPTYGTSIRASMMPPPTPRTISAPTNGTPIQNLELWGLKTPTTAHPMPVKEKKRSIFGFRMGGAHPWEPPSTPGPDSRPPPQNVFGLPLLEAVECSQPPGIHPFVPAVVYRCVEYLQEKDAINEEGLFRLSGSNVTIKALRERFIQEGDVRLLEEEYYDVHAVASLLKLYLRELPSSILTRDLHLDFLKVNDLTDHQKKVDVCNVLVHKLPKANLALLDYLCSFLVEVIDNSAVSKMGVRNRKFASFCIIFDLTLNSWNRFCADAKHSCMAHLTIPQRLQGSVRGNTSRRFTYS